MVLNRSRRNEKSQSDSTVAFVGAARHQVAPPQWLVMTLTMVLLKFFHRQATHLIAIHGDGRAVLLMQLLSWCHDGWAAKGVLLGHCAVLVDVQCGAVLQRDEFFTLRANARRGGNCRTGHDAGSGQDGGDEG